MKASKIFVWCVLLIFMAAFAGCTATSQMKPNLALNTGHNQYPVCAFSVESNVNEDLDKELIELKSEILKRVSHLNIFRSIQFTKDYEKAEGCLLVVVSISEIKKLSGSKRFFLGAMAARAKIKADITFIDAAAQETIGSYTVTGKSGGSDFSGGTGEAIRKTAEAIVEIIQENYKM
ncbi:MAG: hypothetical protein JSV96_12320 [Candidatus Aminicenantes bacterium]|nr:MAG: hypothetical protein JSV96_12320 [Candidatus Aminicenantes bacterium]